MAPMGDIALSLAVKTAPRQRSRRLTLYFDTGSRRTFIRDDVARRLGNVSPLKVPISFTGLGDGGFQCAAVMSLYVRLKGIWCEHLALVASRRDLDDEVLVGHDFMQIYNIRLDPKKRAILLDKASLVRAQRIRSVI